uniref:Putative secreted protein n=1 Tax=Panstrongylus lignarius TaxID=156445 RepID=A0A224Y1R4_9HEMI
MFQRWLTVYSLLLLILIQVQPERPRRGSGNICVPLRWTRRWLRGWTNAEGSLWAIWELSAPTYLSYNYRLTFAAEPLRGFMLHHLHLNVLTLRTYTNTLLHASGTCWCHPHVCRVWIPVS